MRRLRAHLGGSVGNERLTALNAVVLLVLLAAEGATIPFIGGHLSLHVFIGLMLVPPVALKLASTGWRFARYYLRAPAYLTKGPPALVMRLLVAPLTVASTLALFGSGVLLVVLHPQRGLLVAVHKASFLVWLGAMTVHVLGHVVEVPRLARADLSGGSGAWLRGLAVSGAVVLGVILGIASLSSAHAWAHWAAISRHDR